MGQRITDATRYLNDSICHSFTEEGLVKLHEMGADFRQQEPLCRNYFPFISDSEPEVVDVAKETLKQDVDLYYTSQDKILRRNFSNFTDFADTMRDFLASTAGDHIYIYQYASSPRYWRTKIVSPYIMNVPLQRMVLPWQNASSSIPGECNHSTFSHATNFQGADGGVLVV